MQRVVVRREVVGGCDDSMYSGTESDEYERTVLMSATVCQLT